MMYGAPRPYLSRAPRLLLVTLLVCVVLSASVASAIDFHLFSSEHTVSTADSPDTTPQAVIAADGGAQHCFLVEMDTDARRGAVSFTYDSNLSITDVRSQLLVSTHLPSTSTVGLAVLDSADHIVEVTTLTPYELRQFNDAADRKEKTFTELETQRRQSGEADATSSQPTFDRTAARLITVHFHAASSVGTAGGTRVKPGTYAICFSLDARRLVKQSARNKLVERVTIGLVDVSTTRQVQLKGGGQHIRRPSGSRALRHVEGIPEAAWSDPKELLRRELEAMEASGAKGRAFADYDDELLTSAEVHAKVEALMVCWRELKAILRETDHLLDRFLRMRQTAESTFTRVWVSTVFIVGVCFVVVWSTFRYTRKTIVKRKLI